MAHEDFRHHVRRYLYVFYALLFGTLVTVGGLLHSLWQPRHQHRRGAVYRLRQGLPGGGYFMHLISERKMIYGLLAFTACFFLRADVPDCFGLCGLSDRLTVTH